MTKEEYREYNRLKMAAWRKKNPKRARELGRLQSAKWRKENPERTKHFQNKWRDDHPETYMWRNTRKRARKHNIPFNIEPGDLFVPKKCPILGIKLLWGDDTGRFCSPSIDRINPNLGYIKGNVAVISMRANNLKSNGTLEEFINLVKWLRKEKK